MPNQSLIFYHSPQSRSLGTHILLEELEVPYELRRLNMKKDEQRGADYLSVNPMGKVPAINHRGVLVTEQVAVFLYLADTFAEKKLAPSLEDPLRGTYLRWMVYYAASFEPAVMDRALKREPAPTKMCPYGDFETMWKTFHDHLSQGDYLLKDRFSAVDILWGCALSWMVLFKLVPETEVVKNYVTRMMNRPSALKALEADR
jgi:glutathione S-transferase